MGPTGGFELRASLGHARPPSRTASWPAKSPVSKGERSSGSTGRRGEDDAANAHRVSRYRKTSLRRCGGRRRQRHFRTRHSTGSGHEQVGGRRGRCHMPMAQRKKMKPTAGAVGPAPATQPARSLGFAAVGEFPRKPLPSGQRTNEDGTSLKVLACATRSPRDPAVRCGLLAAFNMAWHATPARRHEVFRVAARLIGERTPTPRDAPPGYRAAARA